MYLNGQAVEQNYKLALQFFQLGAQKGMIIGNMPIRFVQEISSIPRGVCQISLIASLAFLRVNEIFSLGDPNAELSLAHCYSYGKGVTQDLTKAFEYHVSAAEKGDDRAVKK